MAKKTDVVAEAETLTERVLERHDPDPADGDADPSGDPTYEFMLNPDTVPPDANPVYVDAAAKNTYKGLGYREVKFGDGIELLCGAKGDEGANMAVRDHDLMICDRERHEKRERNQRKVNTEVRSKFLKNSAKGDVFVGLPGGGGRMSVRSSVRS